MLSKYSGYANQLLLSKFIVFCFFLLCCHHSVVEYVLHLQKVLDPPLSSPAIKDLSEKC